MAKEFSLLARPETFLLMNILSIQHKVFVFHVYLLILREREREEESAGRGGGREREREKIPSKLCTVSAEPIVGLELMNGEIMT